MESVLLVVAAFAAGVAVGAILHATISAWSNPKVEAAKAAVTTAVSKV